jgi:hypothetical protein
VAALWTRDIASSDICGQHDRKASVHASHDTGIFHRRFRLWKIPFSDKQSRNHGPLYPKGRVFGKFGPSFRKRRFAGSSAIPLAFLPVV